jgi:DNA-binding transcriptional ArsR family regulator
MVRKLTPSEKYRQLKKHTEDAGMVVKEKDGKIIVKRKKKKNA